MADSPDKDGPKNAEAEKAYADAVSNVKSGSGQAPAQDAPAKNEPAKAETAKSPAGETAGKDAAPAKAETETKPAAKSAAAPAPAKTQAKPAPSASKPAAKKAAPRKKAPAAKSSASAKSSSSGKTATKAAPKKRAATAKSPTPKPTPKAGTPAGKGETPSVQELKDKIMATSKTNDYTDKMTESMSDAVSEMQTRAQAAYEKTNQMVSEMTDLTKGNMEAMVESGKILSSGMQTMGKTYVEEAKAAYETATGDMKEMAAVKSPTELFQLQGKIMRRNFDMMVQNTSKNSEAMMKLMNDAMAPVSGRMNKTVESMGKVTA